jgi:hypothetical protein
MIFISIIDAIIFSFNDEGVSYGISGCIKIAQSLVGEESDEEEGEDEEEEEGEEEEEEGGIIIFCIVVVIIGFNNFDES